MKRRANRLAFADIRVGDAYEFSKTLTRADGAAFAKGSGDYNPLHTDRRFGARSRFKKNVAHGMLVTSFFSALVGMYCPGERSLYLGQTARFFKPVFYGDRIRIKGLVLAKSEVAQTVRLKTEAWRKGTKVVDGEAMVAFLTP